MIKLLDSRISLELSKFSDGTRKIEVVSPSNDMEKLLSDIGTLGIKWMFENDDELVSLMFLVDWLRDTAPGIHLYLEMPYVPYARMDRVERVGDVFTLKYFARIINSLRFDYVKIFDPHSRVTPALIDRVKVEDAYTKNLISKFIGDLIKSNGEKELTVLFPDRGSYERYTSLLGPVFEKFKMSVLYGEKTRDWATSKISSFSINTRGKKLVGDVVIIDDIITTGGTIRKCIEALDKMGADSVNIYSTFLERAALENESFRWILNNGGKVYTCFPLFEVAEVDKKLLTGITKISL
jgi:ribose-phosphate pyrophosphokinase